MTANVTVYDVLRAVEGRAERRMTPASSRLEIANALNADRVLIDPLVDEAHNKGYIDEHPRYRENWQLTDDGRAYLDAPLFER